MQMPVFNVLAIGNYVNMFATAPFWPSLMHRNDLYLVCKWQCFDVFPNENHAIRLDFSLNKINSKTYEAE